MNLLLLARRSAPRDAVHDVLMEIELAPGLVIPEERVGRGVEGIRLVAQLHGILPTEEVAELMESHDLDKEEAEHVQEIMEEYGLDEDDAVELADEL